MDWLLGSLALWFSVPAVAGSVYFVMQVVMGQLGGDADLDGDINGSAGDADPGAEFRVLSLQTLSAFAMGGGWMGVATLALTDVGFVGASVISILSGVGVAWLLVAVMRALLRLQSSGNISLESAVGETGRVCVLVPASGQGRGRVQVVVQDRQVEFNAVQLGGEPIASRTPVRVVDRDDSANTLIVEALA